EMAIGLFFSFYSPCFIPLCQLTIMLIYYSISNRNSAIVDVLKSSNNTCFFDKKINKKISNTKSCHNKRYNNVIWKCIKTYNECSNRNNSANMDKNLKPDNVLNSRGICFLTFCKNIIGHGIKRYIE